MTLRTTTREEALNFIDSLISAMDEFKTVERKRLEYSALERYANTQFPVVSIVGSLPDFINKRETRTKNEIVEVITSKLTVEFYVYFQDNVTPDTSISTYASLLFAKLYANQSLGGVVQSSVLKFGRTPQYWEPYVAFNLTAEYSYFQLTGGI